MSPANPKHFQKVAKAWTRASVANFDTAGRARTHPKPAGMTLASFWRLS